MPKYYVSSGDLQQTIDRDNPKTAAIDVFMNMKNNPDLGKITLVSESGYDSENENDMYFCTLYLLDETNQLDAYLQEEWF